MLVTLITRLHLLSPKPLVILSRSLATAQRFHKFVDWKTVLQMLKGLTLKVKIKSATEKGLIRTYLSNIRKKKM